MTVTGSWLAEPGGDLYSPRAAASCCTGCCGAGIWPKGDTVVFGDLQWRKQTGTGSVGVLAGIASSGQLLLGHRSRSTRLPSSHLVSGQFCPVRNSTPIGHPRTFQAVAVASSRAGLSWGPFSAATSSPVHTRWAQHHTLLSHLLVYLFSMCFYTGGSLGPGMPLFPRESQHPKQGLTTEELHGPGTTAKQVAPLPVVPASQTGALV